MPEAILSILSLLFAAVASGAILNIPSADGDLTINGVADEDIWRQAVVLPIQPVGFGAPFPEGGEMRAVVRGGYLCLSARLPEPGRVVSRSTGRNPVWWREDLVTWSLRYHNSDGRNTSLTVSVNPLGGCRVEPVGAGDGQAVIASASVNQGGWGVEAAIQVSKLAPIGFISVERIRVPRPDAPELRWYWPGVNDRFDFQLASGGPSLMAPMVVTKNWGLSEPQTAPATAAVSPAAKLASVPHRVWSDAEGKSLAVEEMWEKNLKTRVAEVAAAEKLDWEKVASGADWQRFRDQRIGALKASLGPFPARTPLRTEVTRRLDYGQGFVVENVIFESRPGLLVSANLYLPEKVQHKIPAVVMVHSHHAPKEQSELQDMGMTWARSGVAVLVPELFGGGERVQSQPWPRESYYSRYAMGMQLYLAGESLMKWMVWDLMRGVDMLLERPYVDPKHIIMIGAVAGGGDPAAVTAALDERIAAVIPFNFGEAGPEQHYTAGPRPYDSETANPGWGSWESTRSLRGSIAGQFFPWLICASVAPRPFLYAFEVTWPNGVEQEPMWKRYKKVFELTGKPDHLDQVDGFGPFPGPGECTNVGVYLRKKIYPILKRWLDINVPVEEYHNVRPEQDLMCLTAQAAAERRPKAASELALPMAERRLSAARAKLAALPASERLASLRASLKARLGDIEPNPDARANAVWAKDASGLTVEAITLETAPGMRVPMLLVKPSGSGRRFPVVLALAQRGKEGFLAARRDEVVGLLKQGIAICLADVRGTGEAGRNSTSLAATELMLGNTALGARLKDARTVVRYLAGRGDLDGRLLALWGESFAGVNPRGFILDQSVNQQPGPQAIQQAQPLGGMLALLTALYEDDVRAVAIRGGLVSYLSVLRDRFCHVPLDIIVPGILEAADTADVVSALAPRGVLLAQLVDGRDRSVTVAEVNAEFRVALDAYQSVPSKLAIRKHAAAAELSSWIGAHLSP